jgi:AraC-like DNA-binding protein
MLQQRPGLAAIPQPLYKFMAGSAGRFPFSVFAAALATVAPILQQAALRQSTVRRRAQDAAQPASVAAVPMRARLRLRPSQQAAWTLSSRFPRLVRLLMLALDVIVRVAAATLWLWLAARLLHAAPRERLVRWFVPLALGAAGFLAGNTPHAQALLPGVAADVAGLLSGSAAVFLWWFCLALFDDGFRFGPLQAAVAAVWWPVMLLDRGVADARFAGIGLSWVLVALGLAMCLHLVVRLLRDRAGDLVETRRRGRLWVVAALLGLLLTDLLADVAMGFRWKPWGFVLAQNLVLLAIAWHLALRWLHADIAGLGYRNPVPAPGPDPRVVGAPRIAPATPPPPAADAALLERLTQLMDVERAHRDPTLTIAGFAARMGAAEPEVRRLVNQHLGWRHFRNFLNHYRLQDAKAALVDPVQAERKILAIAFDAGFASLPSFNRSFRDTEGMAPGEYRARALSGDSRERSATGSEHRSRGF